MTEKRFDWDLNGIWDFQSDSDEYLESSEEICELLNRLHEENEQLKQKNKDAWNLIRFIYNEIKEDGYMDWGRIQDLVEF